MLPSIRVSANRRFFETSAGEPFYYLGETGWEIFHRCTREEADLYLRNRAAKGYNVIQAVVIPETDGLRVPNPYGAVPFEDMDPARPVEAYWQHVDWVVRRANELGMYVALLPTWGDKWMAYLWGVGPQIFNEANARAYGEWVGRRYREAGVFWVMGGDRPIQNDAQLRIVRAMAEGVRAGDGGRHLMTFHPPGCQSSSRFVHGETWMDFHMQQTGHDREFPSYILAEHDWDLMPVRPFINGEPSYEAHPNRFMGGDEGWLDQEDVRRECYRSLLGGAAGVTYGCHAVWQFYKEGYEPINGPRAPWYESLDLPAAGQMRHLKALALSRPFADREPINRLLEGPQPARHQEFIRVLRGRDGTWAWIYVPNNQRVQVKAQEFFPAKKLQVRYFNPRDGKTHEGGVVDNAAMLKIQAPFDPTGRDWVILIDDPSKHYLAP